MPIRKIIEIDEDRCTGCGACVPGCAEAALAIVDGKARLVKDIYCDGLGACLGHCPEGALRVIEREAPDFDAAAALAFAASSGRPAAPKAHPAPRPAAPAGAPCACQGEPLPAPNPGRHPAPAAPEAKPCGCPGQAVLSLRPAAAPGAALSAPRPGPGGRPAPFAPAPAGEGDNDLGHWPVQIRLVPPDAPFLRGADLAVAADCAAVAVADFHRRFVRGKAILLGCPKFDNEADYAGRFAELFARSGVRSVTVVRMEVPCCAGLPAMVRAGLAASGQDIPLREIVVTRTGGLAG